MDPDPKNSESNKKTGEEQSADYVPYPKIDPKDVAPVQEDFKDVAIGSSQPEPLQNSSPPAAAPKKTSHLGLIGETTKGTFTTVLTEGGVRKRSPFKPAVLPLTRTSDMVRLEEEGELLEHDVDSEYSLGGDESSRVLPSSGMVLGDRLCNSSADGIASLLCTMGLGAPSIIVATVKEPSLAGDSH
ncbi:hypothetical protein H6P81_013117 [Aristolochia fimbriata]|uniref:Uncharacterized protein n=1 Tax=Aristolochia fimbriata TaxID=158543 RepID=A0AAV7EE51_ARIFI|nr:hypothetical protein H6P81_013117 [Aristolochia fimbriata]